jgi:hypothetical protein
MFLPPTMLPHGLRVLVDPPMEFPEVHDEPRDPVSSSRWSRLRSTVPWTRPARRAQRSLVGRPNPCD